MVCNYRSVLKSKLSTLFDINSLKNMRGKIPQINRCKPIVISTIYHFFHELKQMNFILISFPSVILFVFVLSELKDLVYLL